MESSSRRLAYFALAALLLAVVYVIAAPEPASRDSYALSDARSGHVATVIGGKILVTGGVNGTRGVSRAEIFDPRTQTFEAAGYCSPRTRHTATAFDEERVLIAGGEDSGLTLYTSEIFDVTTRTFRNGPQLAVARAGHTATAIAEERVVVVGGDGNGTIETFTGERFELSAAHLTVPRSGHSAQKLADGTILIAGGIDVEGRPALNAEIYDPVTDSIRPAGHMLSARMRPELRLLPDGKVQVIGGDAGSTMEIFVPEGGYFTARGHLLRVPKDQLLRTPARALAISAPDRAIGSDAVGGETLAAPRSGFTVSELADRGVAVVIGGTSRNGDALRNVAVYSASTASITTDRADYPPDTPVKITGTGWAPGETVTIAVVADGQADPRSPLVSVADTNGNFTNTQFRTTVADIGVTFILTATGGTSGYSATTTFTDRASANLDQCANGTVPPYTTCEWVNGNLGASKATYFEGDTVAYRMRFGDLTTDVSHTVTFEWDTTKNGMHAIDYLATFNRTVTNADPCIGVAGCSGYTTYSIPADPRVTGAAVPFPAGNFRLYGGTITAASVYGYNGTFADSSTAYITLTFTPTVADPVLAWGGHIATRANWGADASAVAIPGSPYHMMLVSLDGSGGAQDRSLSAEAVIYPATVKVIKDAVPDGSQSFSFTTSGSPLSNFSLVDDGTTANTKLFGSIIVFGPMSVAETAVTGWKLTGLACTETMVQNTTEVLATGTANIGLEEGEDVICTYTNTRQQATLTVIKHVINDNGGTAVAADFTMQVTGTNVSSTSFAGAESPGTNVTLDPGAFSVDETAFAGYTKSFSGDCSGTIAAGESKTCTITNNDQQAYLTVTKVVNNTHGGTAKPDDFKLTIGTNATTSGTKVPVNPGTYAIGETLLAGYTFDGFSGDCSTAGSVTVKLGESKTCTLTNSDQQAWVIVKKVVVNDNGGSAAADDFKLTLDGNATTSGTKIAVTPGSHTAAETQLDGYAFEGFSGDCDATGKVEVALGETKTCTLTNNDRQAYVIVEKKVVNDNGGSAAPDDFKLTLDGKPTTSGTKVAVNPGTYAAAETQLDGYAFTGFSGDCDATGKVTVKLGETKTCTLTNDDQQAYVIVEKKVVNDNGGSAAPDDFKLTLDGQPTTSGTKVAVNPGTFTAAETQLDGYAFTGFSGDCDIAGKVTVKLGQTKTCTLTNDDQQAYVIVEKKVINDNGGSAAPDDFKLTLDGTPTTSGAKIAVNPGTYTAAETQLSGYTFTGFSGGCDTTGKVTVKLGETKTCTLTNDDQQAYVIVEKKVENTHGGTAAPDDFKLTLDGTATTSGTKVAVNPGQHKAAETLLPGYEFAGFSGDCTDGIVTVALGETKTCTLTNRDKQAYITVVKNVINDDGGSASIDDFVLTLNGERARSGEQIAVAPGTYTAGETPFRGYDFTGFSGDCTADGKITVALGESKTCTLTNNDQPAYIIVTKIVVNDNGGAAVADDFKLTIDGNATASGTKVKVLPGDHAIAETNLPAYSFSGYSGDCSSTGVLTAVSGETKTCTLTNDDKPAFIELVKVVNNTHGGTADPSDFALMLDGKPVTLGHPVQVNAGTYKASERQEEGYKFDGFSGDCDSEGNITVGIGETKKCVLTNSDIQSTITVIKKVINDNGGNALPDDFSLTLGGKPVVSGVAVPVIPGIYVAGETQLGGYEFKGFSGDCNTSGSMSIRLGQDLTCVLTNDDLQSYVIVNKVVNNDNGGNATADAFNLTLDGVPTTSGTKVPVNPGVHTAGETQLPGYTFAGFSGDCDASGKVTVNLGETKTCTLTNDDLQAYVIVEKIVQNTHGGTAAPDDFILTLDGNVTKSGVKVAVNPGAHVAGETLLSGYDFAGFSGACDSTGSVTVALGETKTCTLTNKDQQAFITVVKKVINDNGGTAAPDDFKLTLSGNPVLSGVAVPVNPGTYAAAETLLGGYAFEGFAGECDDKGSISVKLGESKTCVLTNNDLQSFITVVKKVINDNGGSALPDDFKLTLSGNPVLSGQAIPVNPGTYAAAETLLGGYAFEGFAGECDDKGSISVKLGESKTCTLTNNDQQAYVIVNKIVENTHGGTAGPDDFKLTLDGTPTMSGVKVAVNPGPHAAAESLLAGYEFAGFSGDCDASGTVTAVLGETKTCTITNRDRQAFITVIKNVINDNGGNALPEDFNLTLGGNPVTSGIAVPVLPGTYVAAETQVRGYTFKGFSGDCDSAGSMTIKLGQSLTCTLTNDDLQSYVIVTKHVRNGDGGTARPDDFKLTLNGQPVKSGTTIPVNPGTYTAAETQLPGYDFRGFEGDCNASGVMNVELGDTQICRLYNDDQPSYVTVVKVVRNLHGGTAAPDDFNLTVDGQPTLSGEPVRVEAGTHLVTETLLDGYKFIGFSGDCDATGHVDTRLGESKTCIVTNEDIQSYIRVIKDVVNDDGGTAAPDDFKLTLNGNPVKHGVDVPVNPGTYTAGETLLAGYVFEGFSGDCDSSGTITIGLGQMKTCVLKNNDLPSYIVVKKSVINDNGGTALPDDFKLTLGSGGVLDGVKTKVVPGIYRAGETQLPGYRFTGFSGDCDSNGDITVALGQTKVCTLENDDLQAYVIVEKTVVNDDGGSAAPDDFKLTLDGNPVTSGVKVPVNPGTFKAGETQLDGYVFEGFSGDCNAEGSVTVALGETRTCKLTNNDKPAYITIVKTVINDSGGSAVAADFKLTLNGNPVISGTKMKVMPGTYTAAETQLAGYTFTGFSGDCDTNGTATVKLGDDKTCTLTNDDLQAYIIVNKTVINDNGGSARAEDFNLTLDKLAVTLGTKVPVNPGSHVVAETLLPTYTFSGYSGDCPAGVVNIALGETKSCTLTNDDKPAKLIVKKHVIDGGTKTAADFTMNVTAVNPDKTTFPGSESGTTVLVSAGAYQVTETAAPGFATSYSDDCKGTIAAGETKTCTVTNVKNSIFTNSMLCMIPNNQFRNLLLQDPAVPATFNLNATNPGQFYYNVFYSGTPGAEVTLNLALPYPFITQGATPVHVYSGFTSDDTCFTPVGDVSGGYTITSRGGRTSSNGSAIVTLPDYVPQAIGTTTQVTVSGIIPSTGFMYVTVHLDYGLKQTGGWTPDASNGAHQGLTLVIAENQRYTFMTTANGSQIGIETPTSVNVFKKNPGVAGFVQNASDTGPVQGVVVTLKNPAGSAVGTFTSDENGFYLVSYKHTGKAADYTIGAALPSPQTKTVTLKANALAMVNFVDPSH